VGAGAGAGACAGTGADCGGGGGAGSGTSARSLTATGTSRCRPWRSTSPRSLRAPDAPWGGRAISMRRCVGSGTGEARLARRPCCESQDKLHSRAPRAACACAPAPAPLRDGGAAAALLGGLLADLPAVVARDTPHLGRRHRRRRPLLGCRLRLHCARRERVL
jgi:hypothetical protein